MMHCAYCDAPAQPEHLEACDADTAQQSFVILFCGACGCGRLQDPPSDHELARYYEPAYYGRGTRKFLPLVQQLFDAGKRGLARAVMSALEGRSAPRVLDVGCGTGQLLVELERLGAQAVGIEREGGAARAVRPGLNIIEGDLEDQDSLPGNMEAVVIWHVLEHLQDPVSALHAAGRLLAPGGLLFLAVPNAASWQARLFGRHWFHLDLPRHLHFLTLDGLGRMLVREGFTLTRTSTMQVSQGFFGFVQSVLNAVFPGRPNRLYRLMREPLGLGSLAELAFWGVAAVALAPLALTEVLCAGLADAGAIRIIVARKA
jgi:SAM-dependent methyltransferase